MNSAQNKTRETNPKANAHIVSQLFFFFALKTILKGARKDLDQDDIYEILKGYRSDKLGSRIDTLWIKEMKKPKPWIWRPIIKIFGFEYALIGAVDLVVGISLSTVMPLLTGKVISYFEPGTKLSKDDALTYAAMLLGCTIFFAIYDNAYFFILEQLTMRIRIACCSMMYRKCLRLSESSMTEYAGGKALTLMTKDILQSDGAADYGLGIFHCLLRLIIMTYIMYREIGDAALYGSSVLFLLLPLFGKKCQQCHFYSMLDSKLMWLHYKTTG